MGYESKNNKEQKQKISEKVRLGLVRLFPTYLLCFIPFLVFGTRNDIRLILWKTAVVGAGLVIFHFVRKSMFPYIDLQSSYQKVLEEAENGKPENLSKALIALSQTILISAMAVSIIFAVAGGI